MEPYKIEVMPSVAKDLKKIPRKDVDRILKRIESLAIDPRGRGCEKLTEQDRYRVRQGVYRILYEIQDGELVVCIVKVDHRSRVYN